MIVRIHDTTAVLIASLVDITITELLSVSVIGSVRRTKYTMSMLETKILCILIPLRSASGSEITMSEITMTLLTLPLDDWPPVQILTGIVLCSISYRLYDKLLWIHDFPEVQYHFTCS